MMTPDKVKGPVGAAGAMGWSRLHALKSHATQSTVADCVVLRSRMFHTLAPVRLRRYVHQPGELGLGTLQP
jgi:hypothetical protein